MISLLIYGVATVAIAVMLSMLTSLLRPVKGRADSRSIKSVIWWLVLCVAGPFVYVEGLTIQHGPELKNAVHMGFEDSPLIGSFLYFKVLAYDGTTAKALMIGQESEGIGFTDRPIVEVLLKKTAKGWEPAKETVLYSQRLNKDEMIMPPFR